VIRASGNAKAMIRPTKTARRRLTKLRSAKLTFTVAGLKRTQTLKRR
jgi:hypothetical protein